MKNKLPRKRKKAFKKAMSKADYLTVILLNDILYEEEGKPCRFPKLRKNKDNPKGFDIIGYY